MFVFNVSRTHGAEVIKLFSCSVEHEILNANKYINIKKLFGFFRLR